MSMTTIPKEYTVEMIDGAIRIHIPLFKSGSYARGLDRSISEYSIIVDQQPDQKWTIKITDTTADYQKTIQINIPSPTINEFIKLFNIANTLDELIKLSGISLMPRKFVKPNQIDNPIKTIAPGHSISSLDRENLCLSIFELEEKLKFLEAQDRSIPWYKWGRVWGSEETNSVSWILTVRKMELENETLGLPSKAQSIKSKVEMVQRSLESQFTMYRSLRKDIEAMPQYKVWRQAVIEKFGRKCSVCGSVENIEVDHRYKSFYAIVRENRITDTVKAYECAELWNIDNGAPLCKKHHDKTKSSVYYNIKKEL